MMCQSSLQSFKLQKSRERVGSNECVTTCTARASVYRYQSALFVKSEDLAGSLCPALKPAYVLLREVEGGVTVVCFLLQSSHQFVLGHLLGLFLFQFLCLYQLLE